MIRMRKILKEIVAFILNIFFPAISEKGSILMYHSVGINNKFSTVTPHNFERQLKFLKQHNYRVISLSEMVNKKQKNESLKSCISLTFDDGYLDFYTNVFPLLKKYNFPAALFVTTGFIGKNMKTKQGQEFPIVSEAQIQEMHKSGYVEIFPHTKTHPKLNDIFYEDACNEIHDSQMEIERLIHEEANIFAYPFGISTPEIISYLSKNRKWCAAVTVKQGLIDTNTDNMQLNRNIIDSEVGMSQFRMKVSESVLLFANCKQLFRHAKNI